MACCLFNAKPLPEPLFAYNIVHQSTDIFMENHAFAGMVCKIVPSLFRPQCVNSYIIGHIIISSDDGLSLDRRHYLNICCSMLNWTTGNKFQ